MIVPSWYVENALKNLIIKTSLTLITKQWDLDAKIHNVARVFMQCLKNYLKRNSVGSFGLNGNVWSVRKDTFMKNRMIITRFASITSALILAVNQLENLQTLSNWQCTLSLTVLTPNWLAIDATFKLNVIKFQNMIVFNPF